MKNKFQLSHTVYIFDKRLLSVFFPLTIHFQTHILSSNIQGPFLKDITINALCSKNIQVNNSLEYALDMKKLLKKHKLKPKQLSRRAFSSVTSTLHERIKHISMEIPFFPEHE